MKIWVDADACPNAVKEILFRAAQRTAIPTVFVANQLVQIPRSAHISALRVAFGPDGADLEIVRQVAAGDLVITADIRLAAAVLDKRGHALDPRGELYSAETIGGRLNVRDFMETLRSTGVETGGPSTFHQSDRQSFANQLDSWLTLHGRSQELAP
jgi:uncharacterized protein